jgi:uncharacterized protein YacL
MTALGIGGYVVGYLVAPYVGGRPLTWLQRHSSWARAAFPFESIIAAAIGLAFALVIAALLALPLSYLPGRWGQVLPLVAATLLSLIFVPFMVMQGRTVVHFFFKTSPGVSGSGDGSSNQIILDTSAIIDGRIADIVRTGFIQGTLLVPRFVLDELRHIADSSDGMRKSKGRRGLDMLTDLQREADIPVQISDIDFQDTREVDAKLIKLAKTIHAPIISNDFNLNRIAGIEGVRMLNIHELANAVKPTLLPGEEMTIRVVQEGKEQGQGVGFLDDGTMVVVEGGRRHINSDLDVSVTRVLQTAAGRMIFAQPRSHADERS